MADTVEQNGRFFARQQIAATGYNMNKKAALDLAMGLMQGAIDELITILGEKEAYDKAQARVDQICRPTEDQIKAWAPR